MLSKSISTFPTYPYGEIYLICLFPSVSDFNHLKSKTKPHLLLWNTLDMCQTLLAAAATPVGAAAVGAAALTAARVEQEPEWRRGLGTTSTWDLKKKNPALP